MPDGQPLILGQNNTSDAVTLISRSGTTPNPAFEVVNPDDYGVWGRSIRSFALLGINTDSIGVYGNSTTNAGVASQNTRFRTREVRICTLRPLA